MGKEPVEGAAQLDVPQQRLGASDRCRCPCLGGCMVGRRCGHTFKGKGLKTCLLSDNLQHPLVLAVLEYSVGKVLGSHQGGSPHTELPPRHSTGTRSPLVPTQSPLVSQSRSGCSFTTRGGEAVLSSTDR